MMEVALYKPIVARIPDRIILRFIVVLRLTFPLHLLNKILRAVDIILTVCSVCI